MLMRTTQGSHVDATVAELSKADAVDRDRPISSNNFAMYG